MKKQISILCMIILIATFYSCNSNVPKSSIGKDSTNVDKSPVTKSNIKQEIKIMTNVGDKLIGKWIKGKPYIDSGTPRRVKISSNGNMFIITCDNDTKYNATLENGELMLPQLKPLGYGNITYSNDGDNIFWQRQKYIRE